MRNAIIADSLDGWIAEDYLTIAFGSRVTVVGGFHVGCQYSPHGGQLTDKLRGKTCSFFPLRVGADATFPCAIGSEAQSCQDLLAEQIKQFLNIYTDVIIDCPAVDSRIPVISGEENGA